MPTIALVATEIARHEWRVGQSHLIVLAISAVTVFVAVLLQYEWMSWQSRLLPRVVLRRRPRIMFVILGMLMLHTVEVWMFAGLFSVLDGWPELGHLEGPMHEGALDYVYFSVVTYTSLGLGDLVPQGPIRILAGTEALLGLSLITWTASFAFLEMQRDWAEFRKPPRSA